MKIITDNISENLMRHGIVVSAPLPSGILGGDATDRVTTRPSATTYAGRFVGLSTRTLEKYRYKGPAIVEIVLNPDGPLRGDRQREGLVDAGTRHSPEDGERIVRVIAQSTEFSPHHWVKQQRASA